MQLSRGYPPLGFANTPGVATINRTQTNGIRKMMAGDLKRNSLTGNPAHVPGGVHAPMFPRAPPRKDHSSGPSTAMSSVRAPQDAPPQAVRSDGTSRPPRPMQVTSDATRKLHDQARETALEGAKLKTTQQTPSLSSSPPSNDFGAGHLSVVATTRLETPVLHIEGTPTAVEESFKSGDMRVTSITQIPPNTKLVLFFPQLQLKNDRHAVYMRTHIVDSDTGAVCIGYCRCFDQEADTGKPLRYVGSFAAV